MTGRWTSPSPASQKCLAGPPGMSLVTVSPRAWEAMESNPGAPRGSFQSLLRLEAQV